MHIGIIGLPNVGKSTLFNALTRSKGAVVANYPFCTIEPNVGIVEVPDERLQELANIVHPEKIIPAIIEFVDIAGLVKGASEGQGLGNKFLSHIRNCDALLQVVRIFENKDIQHVSETIDPKNDIEVINTELMLADLETIHKRLKEIEKKARSQDKEMVAKLDVIKQIEEGLSKGTMIINQALSKESKELIDDLHLITAKPILYAANLSENQIKTQKLDELRRKMGLTASARIIPVSAQIEEELNALTEKEVNIFLEELGLKESTLNALIRESYEVLGLQTFLTAGPKEVKAWTIRKGCKAPKAAGVIHSDFEKNFIKAEICNWKDFVELKGESHCREMGKIRIEGKEYVMQEGDVVHFLVSV